ncbi:MAG: hypothetical protein RL092_2091 [Bacteroidota bacterium]|jgi:hypothetical protein
MKQLLFLTLLFTTAQLYGQAPIHFLISSDQQINITEPLCEDMIKETTQLFELTLKRTEKGLKKGLEITLAQSAGLEVFKNTGRNPRKEVPLYSLGSNLVQVFSRNSLSEIYLSTNKISLAALGPASVEISLSNITVSPSQTSMDVIVKNPATNTAPIRTHLSLATGILLQDMEGQREARWYFFWNAFFEHTAIIEWLETNITNVNSAVISPEKSLELLQAPIKNSKFFSTEYLKQAKIDAQRILKEVPYPIPFDQIQGILISQDETKLIFKTISTELHTWNEERYITENEWFFSKKNNDWLLVQANSNIRSIENEEDRNKWKINFYRMAFDLQQNPQNYKEDNWTKIVDQIIDNYNTIEFKHVISSETNHQLIEQYIKPQLAKLLQQDTYAYNNFYQRQSPEFDKYGEEEKNIYTTTDFLISNPEQTAFIYPVLLNHRNKQDRYYYYTNEDFKFYVLLKNSDDSYTLYDWQYFKTIPYKNYYNLTNCVESHLTNITDYNSGQEIINDTNFWNNYVYKKSERGYNYLFPIVAQNQSPQIEKAEFEAQVQDCIDILSQYDVKDLYPAQLKQIVLCLNTIQVYNLKGAKAIELDTLSKQLHFKERLNRHMTPINNYYPSLHLEFENDLKAHSYYEF